VQARRRKVCLIRQCSFPGDPRVRKEVLALLEDGHEVDVICQRRPNQPLREVWNGARVFRVPLRHRRSGFSRYVFQYAAFFSAAFLYVTSLDLIRRYDYVQVNTLPDALTFCAVVPRLRGARIIVDFQELMPEMFTAEFPGRQTRVVTWVLRALEWLAARFADHAIIANPSQVGVLRDRAGIRRWTLIPNVPEEGVFAPGPLRERDPAEPFRLMTHGTLVERYGAHVLVKAMPSILRRHNVHAEIVGSGEQLPALLALTRELGVEAEITFSDRWLPVDELARRLQQADVGIVPILSHGYLETVTPNKLFDYVASGVPVVASDTVGLRSCFSDGEVHFFEAGNPEALSEAVSTLLGDLAEARTLASKALQTYEALRWARVKRDYQAIYNASQRTRP
jgi:glycosyltransferase involved in cell wall biosynthesis